MSGSFGIMLFMVRLLNVACKRSSLPTKGSLSAKTKTKATS